jgi:hypothetical protein
MRILIFHGYLLRGTGSNIYNANLARTLAGLGHEVDLFCQDRTVHEPEGVTIHVPDIGRVLPVYVADRYEGFDALPFPHAYTVREQFVSRSDKAVRAQSMRGRMAMLGLYVRQGAPWFADLRAELLSFPAGRHDDQVDALGLVGQLLDKINAGPRPKPPDQPQRDDYRAAFEEMPHDSWKTM